MIHVVLRYCPAADPGWFSLHSNSRFTTVQAAKFADERLVLKYFAMGRMTLLELSGSYLDS